MTAAQVRSRYVFLIAMRWLPVGLLIPIVVLLPLERGFDIAQIGSMVAVQGIVVLLLELPTGGLADAIGRRPVLLIAGAINLASLALLAVADTLALLGLAYLLQGVYRALDSGPLESCSSTGHWPPTPRPTSRPAWPAVARRPAWPSPGRLCSVAG
jgi:DHA1 family tetracycline resistance protein-like MFS transporter